MPATQASYITPDPLTLFKGSGSPRKSTPSPSHICLCSREGYPGLPVPLPLAQVHCPCQSDYPHRMSHRLGSSPYWAMVARNPTQPSPSPTQDDLPVHRPSFEPAVFVRTPQDLTLSQAYRPTPSPTIRPVVHGTSKSSSWLSLPSLPHATTCQLAVSFRLSLDLPTVQSPVTVTLQVAPLVSSPMAVLAAPIPSARPAVYASSATPPPEAPSPEGSTVLASTRPPPPPPSSALLHVALAHHYSPVRPPPWLLTPMDLFFGFVRFLLHRVLAEWVG